LVNNNFPKEVWLVPKLRLSSLYSSVEDTSFRQGLPESRVQGCKSAGWYIALIKHLRNLLITVHGLDFGIPAEMTAFPAFPTCV